MEKIIIRHGSILKPIEATTMSKTLPKGFYSLERDNFGNFYFEEIAPFTLPDKLYGDMSIIDRWLKKYNNRSRNLGILLAGQKGSGKTLTAKALALKSGLPVILIKRYYEDMSQFLCDPILGNCVLFFDEFEKIFDEKDTEILTLLDGPADSHHLCILTINDIDSINENLLNRPSRIYYTQNYSGIDNDVLEDLCDDKLINKEYKDDFIKVCNRMLDLSFDIANALIEDINLFNEPASECIKYLGISKEVVSFTVKQEHEGEYYQIYSDYNIDLSLETMSFRVVDFPKGADINPLSLYSYHKSCENVTVNLDSLTKIDKGTFETIVYASFKDSAKIDEAYDKRKEVYDDDGILLPEYSISRPIKLRIELTTHKRLVY